MFKKLILSAISLWIICNAEAQVIMGYDATVSNGSYNEISGGTVIPTSLSGTSLNSVIFDQNNTAHTSAITTKGYPIGFNFKYDNQLMNQFLIGTHGYLVLGKDSVYASATTSNYFIFSNSTDHDVIGAVYRSDIYGLPETKISYQTEGTSPDRTLTVQYKNLGLAFSGWDGEEIRDTVQLQIKLFESGQIEMSFKDFKPDSSIELDYNDAFKIGIRGKGDDRLMKADSFTDNEFNTDENILSWTSTSYPTDGLTYIFTPPEDCSAPSSQPKNLQLSSTSTAISGSFNKSSDADHYLVLLSKKNTLLKEPEDGSYYAKGDSIGNALVLGYDTITSFTSDADLIGAKNYFIHVLGVNSFCFYGPKYNTDNPITGSIYTKAEAPQALVVSETDSTSMILNATANTEGNDIMIASNTVSAENDYGQTLQGGIFGTPSGDLQVGDSISGGGRVIYLGPAKDSIIVYHLTPNTLYHYEAWTKDASGVYSSTFVSADDVTAGIVPWDANFTGMPAFDIPSGWLESNNADWRLNTNSKSDENYLTTTTNGDAAKGTEYYLETPEVYLTSGINRIIFNILMTQYVNWSKSPYILTDDSMKVQVTTNGTDYSTVATYTKDNMPKFSSTETYNKLYIPFSEAAGQKAKIRLLFKVYGSPSINLKDIRIEEKASCDYPIQITAIDSTIIGDKATITWTPQGEEDAWDIRYKKSSEETWSNPVTTHTKSYQLTGLEGLTNYDVQVRARCSATSQSIWADTYTFQSGLAIPFTEIFSKETSAPSGWTSYQGNLSSPTELSAGGGWAFSSSTWSGTYVSYYSSQTTVSDWYVSPKIDLGNGSVLYNAIFGITTLAASNASDGKLTLVVAKNGNEFNVEDTVYVIYPNEFPSRNDSKTYIASLKGYTGTIRLGLLMTTSDGTPARIKLDSIGIAYSCVNDVDSFSIADTTENSFKATWSSAADKWFVFCREEGDTTKVWETVNKPEFEAFGLKPHTTYELGITKTCEPGDTAKVKVFEITTLGTSCQEPENISVRPKDYTATLTWSGEASGYRLRFRKTGDSTWNTQTVANDTTILLNELDPETTYEYQLQALCSKLVADTSTYTPIAKFTTSAILCAVPEHISITPSFNSAKVTWAGPSDNYELQYQVASTDYWFSSEGKNGETLLTGLQSETDYKLRIRSICEEGDSSKWSTTLTFTTTALPECIMPTELIVSSYTSNSARLSWTAGTANIKWNLRYRQSDASAWTEIDSLTDTTYDILNLIPNTTYLWRVKATCEYNESKWATQSHFTTAKDGQTDNIDKIGVNNISVLVKGKILNISNPEGGLIKNIQIYSSTGQLMGKYELNTTDNAFIRLDTTGAIIVSINGIGTQKTVHTFIRP